MLGLTNFNSRCTKHWD